jgi:hypothetical protein
VISGNSTTHSIYIKYDYTSRTIKTPTKYVVYILVTDEPVQKEINKKGLPTELTNDVLLKTK